MKIQSVLRLILLFFIANALAYSELFILFTWVYFLPSTQSIEDYYLFYRLTLLLFPIVSTYSYYVTMTIVPSLFIKKTGVNVIISTSPYFVMWSLYALNQVWGPNTTIFSVLSSTFDISMFTMFVTASFFGTKLYLLHKTKNKNQPL